MNNRICAKITFIKRILDNHLQYVQESSDPNPIVKVRSISEEQIAMELKNSYDVIAETQRMIDKVKQVTKRSELRLKLRKLEDLREWLLDIFQAEEDEDPPPIPEGTVVIAY